MSRVPRSRQNQDAETAGACLGMGCLGLWLFYFIAVVALLVGAVIIVWKVALG